MRKLVIAIFCLSFMIGACGKKEGSSDISNTINTDTSTNDTLAGMDTLNDSNAIAKRFPVPAVVDVWDLRTEMTREQFKDTKSAELEMQLMRPIYSKFYDLGENDSLIIPQLTEGQKALYFFRKMDEAMSEGGLESLQKSNITQNLPIAARSFKLIDNGTLSLMAEKAALEHKRINSIASPDKIQKQDPFMRKFDEEYFKNHAGFYKKLEAYIRENPEEFIKFTD